MRKTIYIFMILMMFLLSGCRVDNETNEPEIVFTTLKSDQNSITFNLNVFGNHSYGEFTSIELYQDDKLITTLEDITIREFNDLQSNTNYTLRVFYKFSSKDDNDPKEIIESIDIRTSSYEVPKVEIMLDSSTYDNVEFHVDINDIAQVGYIHSIDLYQETKIVDSLTNFTEMKFDNLHSNTSYELRLVYIFDLDDGTGPHRVLKTMPFTTDAKMMPTISIMGDSVSHEAIEFSVNVEDTYLTGEITAINLYRNGILVDALKNLTDREFTGLQSTTKYTVQLEYKYDLNDGYGEKTMVFEFEAYTSLKGKGTENSPYEIFKAGDFYYMNIEPDAYYIMRNDIDFENGIFTIEEFKGVFNGDNYTIYNLHRLTPNNFIHGGLFIENHGVIKNVAFENYDLEINFHDMSNLVYGNHGGLVALNKGIIENIYISGHHNYTINFDELRDVFNLNIGALVGKNQGKIRNIATDVTLIVNAPRYLESENHGYLFDGVNLNISGIAGDQMYSDDVFIENCIVFGDVKYSKIGVGKVMGIYLKLSPISESGKMTSNYRLLEQSIIITDELVRPRNGVAINLDGITETFLIDDLQWINHPIKLENIHNSHDSMEPVYISTVEEFKNIMFNPYGHYVLSNDVNFYGHDLDPFAFYGLFDGNGYILEDVTVSSLGENVGLFSINYGVIRNLGVRGVNIVSVNGWAGSICGENRSLITNTYVVESETFGFNIVQSHGYSTGGLVGRNYGMIKNVYTDIFVSGGNRVDLGGIVGSNHGWLKNSFALGDVESAFNSGKAGGVVGSNDGILINNYVLDTQIVNGKANGVEVNTQEFSAFTSDFIYDTLLWSEINWQFEYINTLPKIPSSVIE